MPRYQGPGGQQDDYGYQEPAYNQYNQPPAGGEDDSIMTDAEIQEMLGWDPDGEDEPNGHGAGGIGITARGPNHDALTAAAEAQREAALAQKEFYQNQQRHTQEVQHQTYAQQQAANAAAQREAERKAKLEAVNQYRPKASDLSQEEWAALNVAPESQRAIKHLMAQQQEAMWNESIAPLLQEIRAEQFDQGLRLSQRQQAVLSTEDRVRMAHPDIDAIEQDPQWAAFLNERDGAAGLTRRAAAKMAWDNNDATPTIALISTFKQTKQNEAQRRRPQQTAYGTAYSSPAGAQRPGATKMFPYSNFLNAREQFINGQLSEQKYNSLVNQVENLAAEGKVDYQR